MPSRVATFSTVTSAPRPANDAGMSYFGYLLDRQQLDVENQRGVGRNDTAGTALSIAELRRNDQRSLAADLHGGDALIPAGDDALHADGKLEGRAAVDGRIEFSAFLAPFGEPAGVVHDTRLALLGAGTRADGRVDDFQAGLGRHDFSFRLRGSRAGSSGESCGRDHDTAGQWHGAAFPRRARVLS